MTETQADLLQLLKDKAPDNPTWDDLLFTLCKITPQRPSWDDTFHQISTVLAIRSRNPNVQLGCAVVGQNHEILSVGYNSLPRKVNDNIASRINDEQRNLWFLHAEENAICNAARVGTHLDDSTFYIKWIPCARCARLIIQVGAIKVIVTDTDEKFGITDSWVNRYKAAIAMLQETHIPVCQRNKNGDFSGIIMEMLNHWQFSPEYDPNFEKEKD